MVFGGEDESRPRKIEPRFKGVRMRKWGRWVSEIRVPNSQARIWLGSYDSAEAAARAYDAALYCLRGPAASFNFGCGKRPDFPGGVPTELAFTEIKSIAARFASLSGAMPASSASTTATATWEQHAMSDGNDLWDVCSTFAVPRAPLLDGVTIGDISYLWSS